MGNNTNTLFLVICGAIVVLTIFTIINNNTGAIEAPIKDFQEEVTGADNGDIPGIPIFINSNKNESFYTVNFKTSENSTRYKCLYGPRRTAINSEAVMNITKQNVTCNIPFTGSDKLFVKVLGINGDNNTPSEILELQ